jgi:cytoskeletal protein CcmA (bactofilin family)
MSNPYDKATATTSSILGPTLKFKGELTANEDLLIQGQIEGSIKHTSNLTIGEEGKIKADVTAEHISIEGSVNGDLTGSKAVVVKESANVKGNIYSPIVTLREGSTFNGNIDMSGKERPDVIEPEEADAANDDPSKHKTVAAEKIDTADDKPKRDRKRTASAGGA